jgi:hypothetical protein
MAAKGGIVPMKNGRLTTSRKIEPILPPCPPHCIEVGAVYSPRQLRFFLGLAKSTIAREIKHGRLRVARRGNKYYFLGQWLLQWLQDGELPPRREGNCAP